jgi:hypothetical protein
MTDKERISSPTLVETYTNLPDVEHDLVAAEPKTKLFAGLPPSLRAMQLSLMMTRQELIATGVINEEPRGKEE